MNQSRGWYADPHPPDNFKWWVLGVRWWNGEVWTPFTAVRRLSWVPVALTGAAGLWVWVIAVALSLLLARDVAATPQPNLELWVSVSEWLPAVPIASAVVVAFIVLLIRRRWRLVAMPAVNAFLWFSVAVVFLALPKAP